MENTPQPTPIKNFKNATVNEFMACWFDEDYKALGEAATKADYEALNMAYIDITGLYASNDFNLVCGIASLDNRLIVVNAFVFYQRAFIASFGLPYLPALPLIVKYGHRLVWNNDKEAFLAKLYQIEMNEKSTQSQLDIKEKQLLTLREKREDTRGDPPKNDRGEFINMLIALGKSSYQIDRDKTTVETLAYMVKGQKAEYEALKKYNAARPTK